MGREPDLPGLRPRRVGLHKAALKKIRGSLRGCVLEKQDCSQLGNGRETNQSMRKILQLYR